MMDLEDLIMLGACSLLKPVTMGKQTEVVDSPSPREIETAVKTAKKVWAEVIRQKNV